MATETIQPTRLDVEQKLRWLRRFATLSDNAFQIPGTRISFGLDALIGLIPGVGDAATTLASLYMIHQARQLGASKRTVARMVANVAIDGVVGMVPLLGDLFDVGWKANMRNLKLLEAELGVEPTFENKPASESHRLFV